jgi:hypothetical protein
MVVVCTDPKLPVMKAGPRDVSNELRAAKAGLAATSSDVSAAAATGIRAALIQRLADFAMSISCQLSLRMILQRFRFQVSTDACGCRPIESGIASPHMSMLTWNSGTLATWQC